MRSTLGLGSLSILATAVGCSAPPRGEHAAATTAPLLPAEDESGVAATFDTSGTVDFTNPFFQEFGTNGRSCGTCHDSRAAWGMTPELAQQIFGDSDGLAPLFRTVDETVRPDADISTTDARQAAFAMLLNKGVTRFARSIKSTAEFEVVAVDDPYGWSTPALFSNFRRIPSAANAAHESSVLWTGGPDPDMPTALASILVGGVKFHEQTTFTVSPTDAAAAAAFLMGLSFAQAIDQNAGPLNRAGATGGPANLSAEPFYLGINALGGDSQTGAPFDNESMDIYDAWETATDEAKAQIGRGQHAFYTLDIEITNIPGINDSLGLPVVHGHCTTCHNTPNVGSHSEFRMIDLGLTGPDRRTADVPLLTLSNKTTGEIRQTTDVGRALNTGLWADVGRFKVPTLRGVGARAPYFHDGSARTLSDVLDFYQRRFGVDVGSSRDDIIAFLQAL